MWVTLGEQLGTTFPDDSAPSEKQWADLLKGKSVLILLDELAFYLVHASTKGSREEGTRFSQRTAIALTNLFGAIRDHKEAARVAIVVADLQKDWDQGHEELAKIMRSDATLGGTLQSADNEMSKGAISISPVDNSKDELYSILRKRLFKTIAITDKEKTALIDAYHAELQTANNAGLIDRALPTIREELEVSYPFHFSTKHLIETFNDNPGLDISGLSTALEELARSCWYLDQLRSGRFFLNKVKNLNAQINSYHKDCADLDRDQEIEGKLKEMFEPKEKRCDQTLHIHPGLSKVSLSREKPPSSSAITTRRSRNSSTARKTPRKASSSSKTPCAP